METNQELLEIYKIHVEMADRISQRRLQTSRFYIALLSGLFALISLVLNKEIFIRDSRVVLILASLLGIVLCIVWWINLHSYKQLNDVKFQVIHELEKQLTYSFYKKEWDLLEEGKQMRSYFQLTKVEKFVPFLMMILYILLLVFALFL